MFKSLFSSIKSSNSTGVTIVSPISGKAVHLEEVPDPAFSQKLVGEGIAIIPEEGKVVSPINGEVALIFPTKHAVGLVSEEGIEILIHIGIDTVSMEGEGFKTHVKQGDKVKVGDLLIEFSLDLVKEKATSTTTPIVITNFDRINHLELAPFESVKIKESTIMKIDIKP
ncbi:PTS system glucose-specific EIIA component [Neobacillus rhizosphaerae]|uniref:PTS system glucose-specific EIIA component n=1 Tax=Neobacillus rhizosphaerae TaxID=2880965 RepID=A0ABM9ET94_9BACI|nr:PTS glucose transporter subunit IIA [Neobacillus rhizosphaerae]CAH2715868.1 PTS system glucose-specific EIIA component [Neobacillus rhizosphaerae]